MDSRDRDDRQVNSLTYGGNPFYCNRIETNGHSKESHDIETVTRTPGTRRLFTRTLTGTVSYNCF